MKIVILDGFTLNPGDLDWSSIERLGEVTIYDRSVGDQIIQRLAGANVVLTNKVPLSREDILKTSSLQYIGVTATGYNIVDVGAARERGIPVTNVPAYGTASVAQHAFALLLELTNRVGLHSQGVAEGDWSRQPDFTYWKIPLVELRGKTMGIIGLGQIGRAVARIALAMDMQVIAVHKHPERDRMDGVAFVDLETCCRQADVMSLHCPLTPENHQFVNAQLLSLMKPTAYLINVSRGPLVHEEDLANALNTGTIAGAGLDVLSTEPPKGSNPLLGARNCIVTPHQAWASQAARRRLMHTVAENIIAFQRGHPVNVVNGVK